MNDLAQITPSEALLSALVAGSARWDAFDSKSGEVCIGGIRFSCKLDAYGVPILHSIVLAALLDDLAKRRRA